ncbi:FG-GAP-like repeat-containing protein [Streptomyces fulvoviolaceus]|uniref:FG-GAP-like repeat-containing protein n=1 Tax=Streptomyces fulvoviolaceus TaxID=285535 RepID=UPI0021C004F8|nr:FG-GAP-like repeat-containing protein [Streptomyces fulvoviolaceus]MCT9081688.1 FG-GAP-like repeat-containing protein [Streptomyces fulvoviolaceus]
MLSLRSYTPWTVPLLAGLLALGWVPSDLSDRARDPAQTPVRDDFDGDGYQDLAIGAPGATLGGQKGAGYVAVLYGGPHGVSATTRRTVISRTTQGIPADPVADQGFGARLSKGDLNGDGYADLVVGLARRKGDAVIVWGSPKGLSGGTAVPATNTQAGDFDGDGKLDLALFRTDRAPGDDPLGSTATVWTGPVTRSGTPARKTALDPEHLKYYDVDDGATGDVNGDGRDELALRVYYGEGGYGTRFYTASSSGLKDATDKAPDGGYGLAFGDVNGDGYDDFLAGSVPDDAGRITVAHGSASGLGPRSSWKSYSQNTPGVPGASEINDLFGSAVAAGDITGDGIDDVAVGAIGRELGYDDGAGEVVVLRGTPTGLTGTGSQVFTQDTPGIPGTTQPGDVFGSAVRLLDINGNGHADLVAAAVGEDAGNGRVYVLRGRPEGVVTDAGLMVGGKVLGVPYAKARFGGAVG